MNEDELLTQLQGLLAGQLEEVVFRAKVPAAYLSGDQTTRAIQTIRYLKERGELEQLARILEGHKLKGQEDGRTAELRYQLLRHLTSWGDCHVFGNVPRERWKGGEAVPFMPLDKIYVEPIGVVDVLVPAPSTPTSIARSTDELTDTETTSDIIYSRSDTSKTKVAETPLVALIEQLTSLNEAQKVVVVTADFGSGKSLTARWLARQWARQFLAAASSEEQLKRSLPIHVRCANDFPSDTVDLELTVRRAWKRQADDIAYSITDDDPALRWPSQDQHMVCLLDGLDEVSLGEQQIKALLQRLLGKTTKRHRFVVFTRPGALFRRSDLGDQVVVVRVQPFRGDQIERWLAAWNKLAAGTRPKVAFGKLQQHNLDEIVRTPILLFMVAFTWSSYAQTAATPSLAEVYEQFFQQIATGKATVDHDRHGPIAQASVDLHTALRNVGLLGERATLADAMLWLMGRVAWEAHMLEQRRPAERLTLRHVDNLLCDIKISPASKSVDTIRIGLILTMQADLHSANHSILFGHKSFREFLVGRYWAMELRRIVRSGNHRDPMMTESLLGGRLLGHQDKSFDHLMQLVNATMQVAAHESSPLGWNDEERSLLVAWAQCTFDNERLEFGERASPRTRANSLLRNDRRAELREAALAIGSVTTGGSAVRVSDPIALRSMLAWFWLHDDRAIIIAPKADLARAYLVEANLAGANFVGANLARANLTAANLAGANLANANLTGAILAKANAARVNFSGANLTGANLTGTDFLWAKYDETTIWPNGFVPTGASR